MPAADAAEPRGLDQIQSVLPKQREKIESLHIRVRRKTTISVERDVLLGWPHQMSLPEYLGTDEVLFAFKGDRRYPPPESVPRGLFTFEVPRDALLEVRDPVLGREALYFEGQTEPDLRR